MKSESPGIEVRRIGEDEDVEAFAPGTAATHPCAVLYQGEHETVWDGTCRAVRSHARALADAGLPVLLRSFSNMVIGEHGVPEPVYAAGLPTLVEEHVGDLRGTSATQTVPLIRHGVVRSEAHLRRMVVSPGAIHHDPEIMLAIREALYRSTIVFSVWERDRIDPGVAVQLARVAQCWVPCQQNRDMLVAAGVPPAQVRVVPHPYDTTHVLNALTRRRPKTARRYYSIGRWEPRKDQHALIGAFLMAFGPEDGATLTVKFSGGRWDGYPTPEQSVKHWLKSDGIRRGWTTQAFEERVTLLGERVAEDQIIKLHFEHNIYVSASHGEAWCLPAFDAKVAGNRLVHVPYGGTADFAGPGDVAVEYDMGPAAASYGWEPGARWARYDLGALATALRAAEPPGTFEQPPQWAERFSTVAVGRQMREYVMEVAERCSPKAAAYYRGQP